MRILKLTPALLLLLFSLTSCQTTDNSSNKHIPVVYTPSDFTDVLEIHNHPKQAKDWDAFSFADQGAWFSFALPEYNSETHAASFPGPFVMTHGLWFSDLSNQFFIEDVNTGKKINLAAAKHKAAHYLPGKLLQYYQTSNVELTLKLIFASNRTAFIRADFKNLNKDTSHFKLGWYGKPFKDAPVTVSVDVDKVIYHINDKPGKFIFHSPSMVAELKKGYDQAYVLSTTAALKQGQSTHFSLSISYLMEAQDKNAIDDTSSALFSNSDKLLDDNNKRWSSYINSVLNTDTSWANNEAYQRIAIKSLMTLNNNWRSAYGDLKYDGLFPSYAVWYFNGFWAWDSWKHSVALSRFNIELAKNQIRTMFAYQDEYGMIADVIYANKEENNWRDTKPPLASWSVWEVYSQSNDKAFIEEMFPKLLTYHRWWYKHRDHDQNGLCEYGSTDGTLVAALWESGMDDAVRYDNRSMLQNTDVSWSIDLESVDLNAYLYKDKLYLAKMAELLAKPNLAAELHSEAETLKQNIQKSMFNHTTGFFNDINIQDKSIHNAEGPEGWIPLWANVATAEQAARVKDVMLNPDKFATYLPFPTVARDNPRYLTGYWRGPVWIDQAYFGIKALENYGFQSEADRFVLQLYDRAEGLKNSTGPIRENYNPENGMGMKVNHFSWSAAHFLLLYRGE